VVVICHQVNGIVRRLNDELCCGQISIRTSGGMSSPRTELFAAPEFMMSNNAAEYCGFCYQARVPQHVVLFLLDGEHLSYTAAEQQEIRDFVLMLPKTSPIHYRPWHQ
jgi:hypothetical protein